MPVRFDLISFICAGTRLPCQSESARAWILNLFHFFLLSSCGFIFISLSPYSTIIFIFGVCFHFILCHNLLVYSSGQVDSDFSFKVQRVHAYNVNEWIKFWISRRCCCWSGGRKCRAIWRIEGNFFWWFFFFILFIWSSTRISSRAGGQSQREWTAHHIQVRTMGENHVK